ncbi:hypothetical protein Tco_1534657 [Tanacetum coccineum]
MEAGPSGSSDPATRSKKRKYTGTNDESQTSFSVLNAHDKRGSLPLGLIFNQVRVNPGIPFKAVQDQLQRDFEVQISMSKAFRAKAKAEREISVMGYAHVIWIFIRLGIRRPTGVTHVYT